MPQKGLKREDGVWGRGEKLSFKSFPLLPQSQIARCADSVKIRLVESNAGAVECRDKFFAGGRFFLQEPVFDF